MSDFQHPDEVIDVLRGPATAAELSGEADTIALMAQAQHPGGRTSMHSTSRRARVATLIAAGVIGFGGVAAAGGVDQSIDMQEVSAAIGEPDDGTTAGEDVTDEETTDEQDATEETGEEGAIEDESADDESAGDDGTEDDGSEDESAEEQSAADDVVEDESTEEDGEEPEAEEATIAFDPDTNCAIDPVTKEELNHGKTVSAVARGLHPNEEWSVVDAAHSDCGKKHKDESESEEESEEEHEEPEIVEEESVDEGGDDVGEPADDADDADDGDDADDADASSTLTTNDAGKGKGASNGKANGKSDNGNGQAKGKKGGK